ncbi:hypothetical protein KLO70_19175 [Clostridioides difficile]|nr:hypothetical protein [Clostridioides difficile]
MQEIQNLENAAKCLKNQCMEEKDTEVLHILLIQARQLNEILKYKLGISSKLEKVFEMKSLASSQSVEQRIEMKTYAQAAAASSIFSASKNPSVGKKYTQISKSVDSLNTQNSEKSRKEFKDERLLQSKAQRLIVKIFNKEVFEKKMLSNARLIFQMRNEINHALNSVFESESHKSVVASVESSFLGNSIILTTMPEFNSEILIQNQQIWTPVVKSLLKTEISVERDEKWGKFVLHDIPTAIFNHDDGLIQLQHEIEDYNAIKLKKLPIWLNNEEQREKRQNASVLIITDSFEQSKLSVVRIAGIRMRTFEFKDTRENLKSQIQCSNCQKYGHFANLCKRNARCQICAQSHKTTEHSCYLCLKKGTFCEHSKSVAKCANCKEPHFANSKECVFASKGKKSAVKTNDSVSTELNNSSNTKRRNSQVSRATISESPEKQKIREQKSPKTPIQTKVRDTHMQDMIAVEVVNNRFSLLSDSE